MKTNPFGFESLAMKGYEDPPEILDFIKTYIDIDKSYERNFEHKILSLYTALKWDMPVDRQHSIDRFF